MSPQGSKHFTTMRKVEVLLRDAFAEARSYRGAYLAANGVVP